MNIKELLTDGGGVILILLTLVQIVPVKVNPWSWFAKKIGLAINGEVIKKVDLLNSDVQSLRGEFEEHEATVCRTRILHFGDEILHGVQHSKEHFDQILIDITGYENYCNTHPDFRNSIAVETIKRVKSVYEVCMKNNSFLQ